MKLVVTFTIAIITSGCASMSETVKPTPEALQAKVAGNLGFAPSEVKIDRLTEATGITYFVAATPKGTYGCSIPSGGMTAAATLGMVNLQPTCTKQ